MLYALKYFFTPCLPLFHAFCGGEGWGEEGFKKANAIFKSPPLPALSSTKSVEERKKPEHNIKSINFLLRTNKTFKHYSCPGPESNRHGIRSRGILSPLRLPIPPPGLSRSYARLFIYKAEVGIEPASTALQAAA